MTGYRRWELPDICPECGEKTDIYPPHGEEKDTGIRESLGSAYCENCGFHVEAEQDSED